MSADHSQDNLRQAFGAEETRSGRPPPVEAKYRREVTGRAAEETDQPENWKRFERLRYRPDEQDWVAEFEPLTDGLAAPGRPLTLTFANVLTNLKLAELSGYRSPADEDAKAAFEKQMDEELQTLRF